MQLFECFLKPTLLCLTLLCSSSLVNAAELLMVEQPHCPFCDRFNHEIGDIYGKTDEAKLAQLIRVQMHEPWPEKFSAISRAQFTPTFILVHNGEEVDRLEGYQGDEFFWFLLNNMLDKLP